MQRHWQTNVKSIAAILSSVSIVFQYLKKFRIVCTEFNMETVTFFNFNFSFVKRIFSLWVKVSFISVIFSIRFFFLFSFLFYSISFIFETCSESENGLIRKICSRKKKVTWLEIGLIYLTQKSWNLWNTKEKYEKNADIVLMLVCGCLCVTSVRP